MSGILNGTREHFASVDTTMRLAHERAEVGAAEGHLISADEQTSGRGRLGREWVSRPGDGLYFSLLLRPPVSPARALTLTLACGLGVARGVGRTCGVKCDLRWPNDVMIGEKKLAGILVESAAEEAKLKHVVVGVGLNINQEEMPPDLTEIGTSLRIETGCEWARDLVLQSVLEELDRYYRLFLERGAPAVIEAFARASSYAKGKAVRIEGAGPEIEGTTAGLNAEGMLLLRTADGEISPVVAGSVRPVARD